MIALQGLKTAIVEGDVVGGTCVNRGCVPSKALLAVSGRMRELQSDHHLKSLGLQVTMSCIIRIRLVLMFEPMAITVMELEYWCLLHGRAMGCYTINWFCLFLFILGFCCWV